PGSNRMRAVSQLFPPSVLRLNQAGPLAVGEFGLLNSVRRSQTAYTSEASFGSAVIDPLSSASVASLSTCSPAGALHVRPPSLDRLARMARRAPPPETLKVSASWCVVPSGEMLAQGSLARS